MRAWDGDTDGYLKWKTSLSCLRSDPHEILGDTKSCQWFMNPHSMPLYIYWYI